MKTVLDMLEKAAARWSEKTAFTDGKIGITFSELRGLVFKIAAKITCHLAEDSLYSRSRPVIVISGKSVYTPALYLGVLASGNYYVPLGTDIPTRRLEIIKEIVAPELVITDDFTQDGLKDLSQDDENLLKAKINAICDTNPQYVIFTSGSTGSPKGVVTSHRSVVDYITVFAETFGINSENVLGNQAPLEYIAGIRDMFLPLLTGCKTVLIQKTLFSDPAELFKFTQKEGVNTICWVSAAFTLIHEIDVFSKIVPYKIKKVFFTGSVMQPKILNYLRQYLPHTLFVNHYGPTEITASCTYYITDKNKDYADGIPIGKAFANRAVYLSVDGEICVRGICTASGYFKDPVKTAEAFKDGVFFTGDLGATDKDGNLLFRGRRDSQIKHMGHRVELCEIEFHVIACEGIMECACLYNFEKEVITLFYCGTCDNKDIATALRQKLPTYMIPRKFIKMENLPKMFNGKIDTQQLKMLF